MVASKDKGNRGEVIIRDYLRKETGLNFDRTPQSGASSIKGLKGDLFVMNYANKFTIECKNYEEDGFGSACLLGKGNFNAWWAQVTRDAIANGNLPMLIYRWNRSKLYCAIPEHIHTGVDNRIVYKGAAIYLIEELNIKELL